MKLVVIDHSDPARREAWIDMATELHREGKSLEEIMALLKERGCWQVEMIGVIQETLGLSHAEAKPAVLFSRVWADAREDNLRLHAQLENLGTELHIKPDP